MGKLLLRAVVVVLEGIFAWTLLALLFAPFFIIVALIDWTMSLLKSLGCSDTWALILAFTIGLVLWGIVGVMFGVDEYDERMRHNDLRRQQHEKDP